MRRKREQERRRRVALGIAVAIGGVAVLLGLAWAGGRWLSRADPDEEHDTSKEATG